MKQSRKYTTAEKIAFVFCLIGCASLLASRLVNPTIDLFQIGLNLNGIGIITLLFSQR